MARLFQLSAGRQDLAADGVLLSDPGDPAYAHGFDGATRGQHGTDGKNITLISRWIALKQETLGKETRMGTIYGFKIDFWTLWGFVAVFLLTELCRPMVSLGEKKMSHLPIDFWYLRIFASVWLIVYVIVRKDAVFLLATVLQMGIYLRNIHLIRKKCSIRQGRNQKI